MGKEKMLSPMDCLPLERTQYSLQTYSQLRIVDKIFIFERNLL